jgi:peptidoglycan-associated lipoprotein
MKFPPQSGYGKLSPLALASLFMLAGCAMPPSLAEPNDALGERLARIEATLYGTARDSDAALALARDLDDRLNRQAANTQPLRDRIDALESGQTRQAQELGEMRRLLTQTQDVARDALELATTALRADSDLKPRLAGFGGDLQYLRDRLASLGNQLGGQGRRIGQAEAHLGHTSALARQALDQASASSKRIEGEVIHSVTLTHDHVMYPLNSAELSARDTILLDELVNRLRNLGHDYQLEIQGHTDDSGNAEYNYLLGEARANTVRRYLHAQGVPLQRMSVISFGAMAPPPDESREGSAGKRRVELVLLR